jgi:hypothetical protein
MLSPLLGLFVISPFKSMGNATKLRLGRSNDNSSYRDRCYSLRKVQGK